MNLWKRTPSWPREVRTNLAVCCRGALPLENLKKLLENTSLAGGPESRSTCAWHRPATWEHVTTSGTLMKASRHLGLANCRAAHLSTCQNRKLAPTTHTRLGLCRLPGRGEPSRGRGRRPDCWDSIPPPTVRPPGPVTPSPCLLDCWPARCWVGTQEDQPEPEVIVHGTGE